jgi:thiamine biosynthesis protein ThiI
MLACDTVIAHYNEIALKLGHRKFFVSRLAENIRTTLADLEIGPVRSIAGRLTVARGEATTAEIACRLALTPGIANVWSAKSLTPDLELLDREVDELLAWWRPQGSFRVEVRRADKSFPVPSPEVAARLGARIVRGCGARVDLKHASTVVYVLIVPGRIYLALEKLEGCGGLPVSTGGRVLLMLSGGIDSPVAGLRMMRRGCRVLALHFHGAPYLSRASFEKARRLCAVLARGQGHTRLDSIAFGDTQAEVVRTAPTALRVVLYRRMMLRIAQAVAREVDASAVVTGESLGQVASQTLTNMTVISSAVDIPVLRPLVGMDKREIMDYARREGTYEISIVPDQDCCTLFVPKHPTIAARAAEVEEAESRLDVEGLVRAAVSKREELTIEPAWLSSPQDLASEIS